MADKLDLFKQAATEMGYPEEEVEGFLEAAKPGADFKSIAQEQGYAPEEIETVTGLQAAATDVDEDFVGFSTGSMISTKGPVNTPFGAKSRADVFSGGINYGTDIGVPTGTTVATPPEGKWEVVEAFGGARGAGYIGDSTNRGYGNSVMIKNVLTGERLRYSHLNKIGVRPGQVLQGGEAFGETGSSGNSSGAHLDLEYYNGAGQVSDPLKSPYAKYL